MGRGQQVLAAALVGVALLAGLAYGAKPEPPPPFRIEHSPTGEEAPLTVHVSGEVRQPGLVKLPAGSRVADAVAAAGGATPQADLTGINLASAVADGAQVMVPGQQAAGDSAMVADGRVRINQAGPAELEQLPGVGPVLAQRIFEYREAHGPFRTIEDLLGVPGVGEGKLEALREAAVVS